MENEKEIIYDIKEKKGLQCSELEILLKKWQLKLEMSDWIIDLKIVEFRRKNGYRQSGDFIADLKNKTATILMTCDPWRGDEEYTLVHELLHVLIYDYDSYGEKFVLEKYSKDTIEHEQYMNKLEEFVHHITRVILGRSDR
jgi:hypothetical protein